jgi:hypothetical protein
MAKVEAFHKFHNLYMLVNNELFEAYVITIRGFMKGFSNMAKL